MAVKIFKLNSGEELIGDLLPGEGSILCKKPAEIYVIPGKDGEPNKIGLGPYCVYGEDMCIEIMLNRSEEHTSELQSH